MTNPLHEKLCTKCQVMKPIDNYYRYGKDKGYMAQCKGCHNARTKADYRKSRDSRLAVGAKYKASEDGQASQRRSGLAQYYREPEKAAARAKLRHAVKYGKIQKLPCDECGEIKVEAHHPRGYEGNNWAVVTWLCRYHHRKLHNFLTVEYVKTMEGRRG